MTKLDVNFAATPEPGLEGATLVLFVDRSLMLPREAVGLVALDEADIARAACDAGFTGKAGEALTMFIASATVPRRVVFVGTTPGRGDHEMLAVDLGGAAARSAGQAERVVIAAPGAMAAAEIALGFRLRCYAFDKYRTPGDGQARPGRRHLTILTDDPGAEASHQVELALAEGVELARDLVNEPGNVLFPEAFADRIAGLRGPGLEVEILRAADLERLGFRALLAVGQGSARDPHVAIMRWNGAPDPAAAPLAFVGKGVCFDSGGISIKDSEGLHEMKADMAGAAAVVGLMRTLARRGARLNAVGVVGLVENMPDGKAQHPGDVVKSLSGQHIEVVDTDYEGRLVLADLVWHVQGTYAPRFIIDLATLTFSVIAGLGRDYAALFTNDDDLAARLGQAGTRTGELVWRLPLGPGFDRQMDSEIADVRNIDPEPGGGCTAANFIQRFVNGRSWAHLDMFGPAQNRPDWPISSTWATGWGVRLLDHVVRRIEQE
ncbi:leucyl aminopeptidase [Pukyongiella litopenaei]|uniref:Probable cytosol aminopeptidase n=1 Tax=Pukyongiella litopenaei TaxID=2605946 RepID=A0A2S0MQV0_9RHOB|nr:leucyl aminopeptidase [Pukyongiella litopenaei]AVO38265.1 leucyl aminopeptidase [Pukyongiella litopenaei]